MKIPKVSTIKHRTNKVIKKKLDVLWSQLVKKQADGKCEVCGKQENLNSHHIVSRKNLNLRWDLKNGCCLCVGCHKFKNESAHLDPIWFIGWVIENRKSDYEYLLTKRNVMFDKDYSRVEIGLNDFLTMFNNNDRRE